MIFIHLFRRKSLILFSSDLFLKAVLIFRNFLRSLQLGRPAQSQHNWGQDRERAGSRDICSPCDRFQAVKRSLRHTTAPSPLGPQGMEKVRCPRGENTLLASPSSAAPAKCSEDWEAFCYLTCLAPDCEARTARTISCRNMSSIGLDKNIAVIKRSNSQILNLQ